nr:hypothetical protein OH826_34700 [Streptomyces sp. NBC_00899]
MPTREGRTSANRAPVQVSGENQVGARVLPDDDAVREAIRTRLFHDAGCSNHLFRYKQEILDSNALSFIDALVEIGQLTGRMAFCTADHGLAPRYFVTALRAAHQVNHLRPRIRRTWRSRTCLQGGSDRCRPLGGVQSPRSTALLERPAADLRRRQRNPHVSSFSPSLDQALSQHDSASVSPG